MSFSALVPLNSVPTSCVFEDLKNITRFLQPSSHKLSGSIIPQNSLLEDSCNAKISHRSCLSKTNNYVREQLKYKYLYSLVLLKLRILCRKTLQM
jgi:hypothetical protein